MNKRALLVYHSSRQVEWPDAILEGLHIERISLHSSLSETPLSEAVEQRQTILTLHFISGWAICEPSLRLFPLPRAHHQGPLLWPLVHAEGEVQCSLFVPSVLLMLDPGFATSILRWIAAVATHREDDNLEESTWQTALSCHFASSWRNECSSSFPKRSFCALMLRLSGVPCFLVAFYFAISNSATSKALNISRQFIKIRKL